MKKLLIDITEVGKDLWNGFVWIVEFADELGEIAGIKLADLTERRKAAKLIIAMPSVKRNCIEK